MKRHKLHYEFKSEGTWKHRRNMLAREYREKANLFDWLLLLF